MSAPNDKPARRSPLHSQGSAQAVPVAITRLAKQGADKGPQAVSAARDRSTSVGTENLIRAIQCLDDRSFFGWLHALKGTAALDAPVADGITALAVVSRLYSLAVLTEPVQAARFAHMAELLIEAGADPWVRIGEKKALRFIPWSDNPAKKELIVVKPGVFLAEACEGRVPPAVRARMAESGCSEPGPVDPFS